MPSRYPIFIDLEGQPVLVVGGGPLAMGRVSRLLEAGAKVTLVAPVVTDELRALAQAGALDWQGRAFRAGDVAGRYLVLAATGSQDGDLAVLSAARAVGTLASVADEGVRGDFALPSLVEKGPIGVAVSTGGAAPGFADLLAAELGVRLTDRLPEYLGLLEELRQALIEQFPEEPRKRERRLAEALELSEARRLAESGDLEGARSVLRRAAGLDPP
ncbi:MAG: bifunctional precorrin-2 dehydrogenase/sirohydrochlorin ferrochelatase [Polyangia bacterium]|jgi:siroheme synthase-like protein|nr:bifunctional precorrin-2 dehydrogenase/sirohydrochlorin ferrochelatase [Polyangia bacterium]